jgi:hypothetical protein
MNSLRMSFWMVPVELGLRTPCSSAATMNMASTGSTAPFMVIDTRHLVERDAVEEDLHVLDESMATPALPTSPTTRGWSES